MKWVNVTDIIPPDTTYNPPTDGIPITDDVTNDSYYHCFHISNSESEVGTGLDISSNLPPDGDYFPPEIATAPRYCGRGPAKQYPKL